MTANKQQDERLADLEQRVAALESATPSTGTAGGYTKGMRAFQPDACVVLEAYDKMMENTTDRAMVLAHQADCAAREVIPVIGARQCVRGAIEAFHPSPDVEFVIKRSTEIAGSDFQLGRWVWKDSTSDEKLMYATAFQKDEDPATVLAELLERLRRDPTTPTGPWTPGEV